MPEVRCLAKINHLLPDLRNRFTKVYTLEAQEVANQQTTKLLRLLNLLKERPVDGVGCDAEIYCQLNCRISVGWGAFREVGTFAKILFSLLGPGEVEGPPTGAPSPFSAGRPYRKPLGTSTKASQTAGIVLRIIFKVQPLGAG